MLEIQNVFIFKLPLIDKRKARMKTFYSVVPWRLMKNLQPGVKCILATLRKRWQWTAIHVEPRSSWTLTWPELTKGLKAEDTINVTFLNGSWFSIFFRAEVLHVFICVYILTCLNTMCYEHFVSVLITWTWTTSVVSTAVITWCH